MSNPLAWTEHFAVGHEEIDRQHRRLLDTINEVDDAVRAGTNPDRVAEIMASLRAAAEAHFRQENSILWQIKTGTFRRRSSKALPRPMLGVITDTEFDQHTAEHAVSLTALDDIKSAPLAAIAEHLTSWFVDHAVNHDSQLKAIFQAMS